MFKNKIAAKLTAYFAVCLLVFSVIVGGIFMVLFRNHTTQLHKDELAQRAVSIAQTLSQYQGGQDQQNGFGAFMRFLDQIAMTDIWLVNQDYELITHGTGQGQGHHEKEGFTYKDLPEDADRVIDEVFAGKTAFSQTFSELLNQPTITVGTPVKSGDSVVGVVLLHAPVNGTKEAIGQGLMMLAISLAAALVLSFLLCLFLSKNFTDPIISKEAHEALQLETLRRDFVANISHELKTPVAVLRGSLEALVDEVVTQPEQVAGYHREMLCETLYLQRLVGDLLDLSRLQNTDFGMELQTLRFDDVVDDAVRSLSHIAAQKGVRICVEKDDLPLIVRADYGRLRQMLVILLDNAIKFSPSDQSIQITRTQHRLRIRDHGAGLSEQDLAHLFERFYKSRSEQNKSGTGLGLAIAKQIAHCHRFAISAQNAPDGGAVFTIDIRAE